MKKIEAVIRHHKTEAVKEALLAVGQAGMTITEVRGFGRQKGQKATYRGAEYKVDFVPKIKIEVAVNDDALSKVIAAIVGAAKTGEIGDGKLFVTDLADVVRIRTGETGSEAI